MLKTFNFGCYAIKTRCQDIIIEHLEDVTEGARMNVINMSRTLYSCSIVIKIHLRQLLDIQKS